MSGVSAIILAAGESTRMGRLKALLPWRGGTLIEYQVESLREAGADQIVVVVGHRWEEVEAPVRGQPGVETAVNPDYQQGKTTSIKTGLSRVSASAQAILVLAVDQPRPVGILKSLIDAHLERGNLITCPEHGGHRGHPFIFSATLMPELMAITEEGQGLREVVDRHRADTYRMAVGSPIVHADTNSPEDLKEAERLFEGL